MKKLALIAAFALAAGIGCFAQENLNDNPDSVLGTYLVPEPGNDSKVEFTKNADGTYDCAIVWMEAPDDPSTGKPWLDVKNPKKELRTRPCLGLKLITCLKYNPEKKNWGGTKVYDPNRGISANVTITFTEDGRLCLKGTVLGIGEKDYWTRVQ